MQIPERMDLEEAKTIMMNQDAAVISAVEELVSRWGLEGFLGYVRGLRDGRRAQEQALRDGT